MNAIVLVNLTIHVHIQYCNIRLIYIYSLISNPKVLLVFKLSKSQKIICGIL